jgi:undecaprenyl phosphate N,N'-diacetylbacillosamine 1-phosphate transferase
MKRIFDVVISLILLFLFLPLLIVISIFVYLFIGWPVIFTQRRPGLNEKIFRIIKFRTMNDRRDMDGNLLPDSERLVRFGKILRSTSLDELPELLNVIWGDMSLVGPRPLLEDYLSLYSENQKRRHSVRPGITGLAQISGRNSLNWEDKFDLDLQYVKDQSLLLDIKILIKTFLKVLRRENINQEKSATAERFLG